MANVIAIRVAGRSDVEEALKLLDRLRPLTAEAKRVSVKSMRIGEPTWPRRGCLNELDRLLQRLLRLLAIARVHLKPPEAIPPVRASCVLRKAALVRGDRVGLAAHLVVALGHVSMCFEAAR